MIHGLLIVNKPRNVLSYAVVEKAKKYFQTKKIGHFGTLDPLAEGVLILGIGHARKFFNFFQQKPKRYTGAIRFGYATATYDSEGEPLGEKKPIDLRQVDLDSLLGEFRGEMMQKPPVYSAKKFKGRPMYKYARENIAVETKPVKIQVYSLKGVILDPETLEFSIEVSSGTYIRSIAHDMGQKLLVGAHLHSLCRESVGEFTIDQAAPFDSLNHRAADSDLLNHVIPIESLLPEYTKIIVDEAGRRCIIHGNSLLPKDILKIIPGENPAAFRLFDQQGSLLALARKDENIKQFKPFLVFPYE